MNGATPGRKLTSAASFVWKKNFRDHAAQANPSLKITVHDEAISFSCAPPGPYHSGPWGTNDKHFNKRFNRLRLVFYGRWLTYFQYFASLLETIIPRTKCLAMDLAITGADASQVPLGSFTDVTHFVLKHDGTMGQIIAMLSDASSDDDDIIFPSLDTLTLITRRDRLNVCFDEVVACLEFRKAAECGIKTLNLCPEWYAYNKGPFDDAMRSQLESLTNVVPFYHLQNGLVVKTSFLDETSSDSDVQGVLPFTPLSYDWSYRFHDNVRFFDDCPCCDDAYDSYDGFGANCYFF